MFDGLFIRWQWRSSHIWEPWRLLLDESECQREVDGQPQLFSKRQTHALKSASVGCKVCHWCSSYFGTVLDSSFKIVDQLPTACSTEEATSESSPQEAGDSRKDELEPLSQEACGAAWQTCVLKYSVVAIHMMCSHFVKKVLLEREIGHGWL